MYHEVRHKKNWRYYEERQFKMVELLGDKIESLLDLGAGQMFVKEIISPTTKYIPIDYFKRFEETLVVDLNKKFPHCNVDVAFCSGIIEYINDVEKFIANVCKCSKRVVISYPTVNSCGDMSRRINHYGYENHLGEVELLRLFHDNGMVFKNNDFDDYTYQPIYYMAREQPSKKRRPILFRRQ